MLKNVLILTVFTFSIPLLSYAADTEKLGDISASSALTQQSVVVEPTHPKTVTHLTENFSPMITESQREQKEDNSVLLSHQETVVPVAPKITRAQKFKKFFSKLFVCLKSTDEEVIQETPVIIKQVEQVAQVINEVKSITK